MKYGFKTLIAAALLGTALFAFDAHALATRTYVATTGDDLNTATSCGRGAPCRNFASAISVTVPGGEVVALDTGGFGNALITFAITLTTLPGETAYVKVNAGTTGITVTAGASDIVQLKNIVFNGANAANTTGLLVNAGHATVKNCVFSQLTYGFYGSGFNNIIDSDFVGNDTAITAVGEGADLGVSAIATTTAVKVSGGNIVENGTAFFMQSPGTAACSQCTYNKYNILVHNLGSASDLLTNIAGNTTFAAGAGSGCTVQGNCTYFATYGGNTNPK